MKQPSSGGTADFETTNENRPAPYINYSFGCPAAPLAPATPYWRMTRQGVCLPAEPGLILIDGGRP